MHFSVELLLNKYPQKNNYSCLYFLLSFILLVKTVLYNFFLLYDY